MSHPLATPARSAGSDADGERRDGAAADAADRPVDGLEALVVAARDGSSEAFAALVDATYVSTYTLALRITGDVEDARDVTQDAYLRAYRSLGEFRGDAQFTTWMYRITANCASTSLKRRRRHRHEELGDGDDLADATHDVNPELRADAADLRDRLLGALDQLPPKLRAVVVLRDVYELSHEAIATELGISVTAAKVRLHRARHRLRTEVFPDRVAEEDGGERGRGEEEGRGEARVAELAPRSGSRAG